MSDERYQDSEISVLFLSRLNWKKIEEICHILPNKLTLYFRNCIYLRICLLVPVDLKIIQQPQWVEEWDAVDQGEAILSSEKNKRKSLKTKVLSDDFAVILNSEFSDGFSVIHTQTFRKKMQMICDIFLWIYSSAIVWKWYALKQPPKNVWKDFLSSLHEKIIKSETIIF